MVKGKKKVVVKPRVVVKNLRQKPKPPKKRLSPPPAVFGPVSTIDTAPVSIGNTIQGSAPVVIPVRDGVRIQGRDFFCNLSATAAATTGWTLVGGAPLVPHALVSSLLKSYAGIYANFVVHGLAYHYVTACPTSVQGDVMLYTSKSVGNPGISFSSANFMSVVLSDHCTVFGPLWQNCTAKYFPPQVVYPTDILNDEDLTHRGPGELFVFTKTNSTQVPGYILLDYDITFTMMQVNIRALTFPISRMKYQQVGLTLSATAVTGSSRFIAQVTGTLLDGTSSGTVPSGTTVGDVFKVIMCVTPATFTNATTSNLLAPVVITSAGALSAISTTISDGFTAYAVYYTTNALLFYPSYAAAVTQAADALFFNVSATVTFNIPAFISLVGGVETALTQSNI